MESQARSQAFRRSARISLYKQKQQKLLDLLAKSDSENDSDDDQDDAGNNKNDYESNDRIESNEDSSSDDEVDQQDQIDSSDEEQEQNDKVYSSDDEEEHQNTNIVDDIEDWSTVVKPIPQFVFDDESSGVKIDVNKDSSPREIFDKIFTKEIVHTLMNAMNNYGKNLFSNGDSVGAKRRKFRELNVEEFGRFIGLCLLQGQTSSPTIRKLFCKDPLYYHPIFGATMSGRRFEQILRCFTCELNEDFDDKLTKIRVMVNMIRESFQKAFSPKKNLSLDESLLLFRGRLSIRQYIKIKAAKYGIEFFELTTSDGYVLNFEVFEGKNSKISEVKGEKTQNIVLRLMEPYLSKGHHVYMDNYYNSIRLSERLLQSQTHSTGTLRSNRKGNPNDVITKKLKKGELVWQRKGDIYISKWKDKRDVLSITTAHHPSLIEVSNRYGVKKNKPTDIAAYNDNMGGVDRADQMVSYYSSPRKTIRWYKKVLFHLLDLSVWNSFYIFKQYHKKSSFLEFRERLIKSLIMLPDEICEGRDLQKKKLSVGRPLSRKNVPLSNLTSSLTSKIHYLEKIPVPENSTRKSHFLRCRQCNKNKIRRETSYRCRDCEEHPPLCPTCVEAYHEKI